MLFLLFVVFLLEFLFLLCSSDTDEYELVFVFFDALFVLLFFAMSIPPEINLFGTLILFLCVTHFIHFKEGNNLLVAI